MSKKIRPKKIRVEASSICQLRCPSCPTTNKLTLPVVGSGFLKFSNFQKILNDNPWIIEVELANLGEIFLNPELLKIIKYAYECGVALTANVGVNLNNVNKDVIEGLVKYKFRVINCAIDGASNETYKQYRVGGNYDVVIENIKKINFFKKKYKSKYPMLTWKFVAFGHNEHEILIAERLAEELDMDFDLQISFDPDFSPVQNQDLVRKKVGVASRQEYKEKHGAHYMQRICNQLWEKPQINWDGKILGCCRNIIRDYGGNAFTDGLFECLNSERITYARDMVRGLQNERDDIPCIDCSIYLFMKESGNWLKR
ncbi:radical SAM protein [Candidatus Pacearchaeota archaeon]|nr:radical SAM protein [Candidatus Pacearchaeota archaeon]